MRHRMDRTKTSLWMRWALALLAVLAWIGWPGPQEAHAGSSIVKCRVEAERGYLAAGRTQKVVVKITLDASTPPAKKIRPAVNLALVLDRSGSMAGEKLAKAKEGAIEAVRRLKPTDIFSVIAYDHQVKTVVPAAKTAYVESIESRISDIRAGGSTALFGGVSQGAAEVRKNLGGRYVHRIILLSDGIANVGPSSPEDLGRLAAALLKEGISVTTVGVGTDYNEDLMARLANNSDGNTYFVESSADLPRIFSAELGDVLSVVAKNVRVIIECPAGVKPVQIIGRDGRIRNRTVELSLNQLYGGQHKFVLLEVEVPPRSDGEALELAVARVSYENPFSQRVETSSGQATARFSADTKRIERSVNIAVQKDYELNRNALAQEEAISLADSGKRAEAATVLKKSAEQLRRLGRQANDEALVKKAERMQRQADEIRSEGMSKKSRKEMKTDSYQTQHQQMHR